MFIIKIENAQVSGGMVDYRTVFGAVQSVTDEMLAAQGYVRVNLFKPHDGLTQKLVPCEPKLENGQVFAMEVVNLTAEEIQAAKDAAMANIRGQRNQLLAATDGTQAVDNPNPKKADWANYRQQLRDLPAGIVGLGIDPRTFKDWPRDPNWVDSAIAG